MKPLLKQLQSFWTIVSFIATGLVFVILFWANTNSRLNAIETQQSGQDTKIEEIYALKLDVAVIKNDVATMKGDVSFIRDKVK